MKQYNVFMDAHNFDITPVDPEDHYAVAHFTGTWGECKAYIRDAHKGQRVDIQLAARELNAMRQRDTN